MSSLRLQNPRIPSLFLFQRDRIATGTVFASQASQTFTLFVASGSFDTVSVNGIDADRNSSSSGTLNTGGDFRISEIPNIGMDVSPNDTILVWNQIYCCCT